MTIALFRAFDRLREEILMDTVVFQNDPTASQFLLIYSQKQDYLGVILREHLVEIVAEEQPIAVQTLKELCTQEGERAAKLFREIARTFWRKESIILSVEERVFLEAYRQGNHLRSLEDAFAHYCVECMTETSTPLHQST